MSQLAADAGLVIWGVGEALMPSTTSWTARNGPPACGGDRSRIRALLLAASEYLSGLLRFVVR